MERRSILPGGKERLYSLPLHGDVLIILMGISNECQALIFSIFRWSVRISMNIIILYSSSPVVCRNRNEWIALHIPNSIGNDKAATTAAADKILNLLYSNLHPTPTSSISIIVHLYDQLHFLSLSIPPVLCRPITHFLGF